MLPRKHPHVRGEDGILMSWSLRTRETPPRAWGRLEARVVAKRRAGNTPTCVGKTLLLNLGILSSGKHPHVRGEDFRVYMACYASLETPPRAWGRLILQGEHVFLLGNTPTCVGKTHAVAHLFTCKKKHPHVRGEDSILE